MIDTGEIEKIIGYKFKSPRTLEVAFIHNSYSHICNTKNNQRLEFLGDSVLSLVVSAYLLKNYMDFPEGRLTVMRASIVSELPLSNATTRLGLEKYLLLGNGEKKQHVSNLNSVKADLFEAVVGAIYADSLSLDTCEKFILFALKPEFEAVENEPEFALDPKSKLNEYALKNSYTIEYVQTKKTGPDHEPNFFYDVMVNDEVLGSGKGANKRDAQQMAAEKALKKLKISLNK